jgi:UrcA family protein
MNTASFAAAAACALVAAKAGANSDVEPVSTIVVSYYDLNLSSKAGQAELRHRLNVAALRVWPISRMS